MTESIDTACVGEEGAVFVAGAFGHRDHTVAVLFYHPVDFVQELVLIKGDFREQDDMRCIAILLLSQTRGGGNPAGVTAHHFHDEYLGGGGAHGFHIQRSFTDRHCSVLGY